MGFMFEFKYKGRTLWRDATEEEPGAGRLINHSRCHAISAAVIPDSNMTVLDSGTGKSVSHSNACTSAASHSIFV